MIDATIPATAAALRAEIRAAQACHRAHFDHYAATAVGEMSPAWEAMTGHLFVAAGLAERLADMVDPA